MVVRWRHLGRGQHCSGTPASTWLVCRSGLTGSSPQPVVGRSSQGLWLPKWVGCAVFYSEVWLVFRDLNPCIPLMDLNGYSRSPQILLQMLSPQKGCTFLEWRFRLVLRGLWRMPVCGYSWLKFKQWTFTWIWKPDSFIYRGLLTCCAQKVERLKNNPSLSIILYPLK